jgi:hypothetical protein
MFFRSLQNFAQLGHEGNLVFYDPGLLLKLVDDKGWQTCYKTADPDWRED